MSAKSSSLRNGASYRSGGRYVQTTFVMLLLLFAITDGVRTNAQCSGTSPVTPVTVTDETSTVPSSRQLVNGTATTVDATSPGQIKVNVTGFSKYTLLAKSASFTANDNSGAFYQMTAASAVTVTLPVSPADGTVYKFKRVSGTAVVTFNASGTDTIDNAGFIDTTMSLSNGGVIELVAVSGGWQVT